MSDVDEPDMTKYARPEMWHDATFREGWEVALTAIAMERSGDDGPAHATVDGVELRHRTAGSLGIADGPDDAYRSCPAERLESDADRIVLHLCNEYGIEPSELADFVQRDHSIVMAFDSLVAEHRPPADLPTTLTSVDDVRHVCAAAGLTEAGDRGWIWSPNGDVGCRVEPDPVDSLYVHVVDRHWLQVATFALSTSALLWHAIQAARSAS